MRGNFNKYKGVNLAIYRGQRKMNSNEKNLKSKIKSENFLGIEFF